MSSEPSPDRRTRIRATLFYLGWPMIPPSVDKQWGNPFLAQHFTESLATVGVMLLAVIAAGAYCIFVSWLLMFRRATFEALPFGLIDVVVVCTILLPCVALWLIGVIRAARGATKPRRLISRMARSRGILLLCRSGIIVLYGLLASVSVFAIHASFITRGDMAPAQVYMLYDEADGVGSPGTELEFAL